VAAQTSVGVVGVGYLHSIKETQGPTQVPSKGTVTSLGAGDLEGSVG
jgi:hypothetical protein